MHFSRACIFIDGENLRHSIVELFGAAFNPSDYLPKQADWETFFNDLVQQADADLRLRTYWYVVDEIDFWPYGVHRLLNRKEYKILDQVVRRYKPNTVLLDSIPDFMKKQAKLEDIAKNLVK